MENSDRLCHAAAVVFLVLALAVACTGESAPQSTHNGQPASAATVPAAPVPSAKTTPDAR